MSPVELTLSLWAGTAAVFGVFVCGWFCWQCLCCWWDERRWRRDERRLEAVILEDRERRGRDASFWAECEAREARRQEQVAWLEAIPTLAERQS